MAIESPLGGGLLDTLYDTCYFQVRALAGDRYFVEMMDNGCVALKRSMIAAMSDDPHILVREMVAPKGRAFLNLREFQHFAEVTERKTNMRPLYKLILPVAHEEAPAPIVRAARTTRIKRLRHD